MILPLNSLLNQISIQLRVCQCLPQSGNRFPSENSQKKGQPMVAAHWDHTLVRAFCGLWVKCDRETVLTNNTVYLAEA